MQNTTTIQIHTDGYIKWLRAHVGHERIYLVYATAFVFNEKGHLLVQERYDFDWLGVPGGALEMNETLAECAIRETLEETGVVCQVEGLIGAFSHPDYTLTYPNGDEVQPWTAAFICRAVDSQIRVDGKEALHAAFRPIGEIRHRLPPQYQDALRLAENERLPALETVYFASILKPYYPILRTKVGTARITLPGCTAVIWNEKSEVLAVHKIGTDYWDLPAGLADLGETTTGTLVREMREETGLEIEPVRILGLYSDPHLTFADLFNGDQARWVDLILECRVTGGELRCDDHEIDAVAYLSLEQLAAQPQNSPLRRQIFRDLMSGQLPPFIR